MRRAAGFLRAQLKRVWRLLPLQMGVSLAVCVCVGVMAALLVFQGAGEGQERYRIGLVGDLSDSYLGFGIAALQTMDDSRLMIELIEMTEAEAEVALSRGELTSVVRVPDGFLDAVVYGENDKYVTYSVPSEQTGLGSTVMAEIADVASTLVTASQSAIYGMQRTLYEQGADERVAQETDRLNLMLINLVLSRSGFGEVEILGYADGLSLEAYYFCRILLLLLLFWGISGSVFFLFRKTALAGMLRAGGVGAPLQILGEYLAYLVLLCAGSFLPVCLLALGWKRELFSLPEWEGSGAAPFLALLPFFFAAAAMFAAFQFFFYELADGAVNGLLLQLFAGLAMAYPAGYFYPSAFLPKRLRSVGEWLPAGAAARFVECGFLERNARGAGAAVIVWLAVFLLAAVVVRQRRILRGE